MKRRSTLALVFLLVITIVLGACSGAQQQTAPTVAPAAKSVAPTSAPPAAAPTSGGGTSPTAAPKAAATTASVGPAPTMASATQAAPPVGAAAGAAGGAPYKANTSVTGNITFWHFWGSPIRRNAIRRVVAGFQAMYPGVKVTETFVPFGDIWTRNIAAVAAGSGMPDVIVEDRPQLPARAQNKIDISLGDLAKRDGIDGKGFWPFTWDEATVNGDPYGLPYETDTRVLYWNKALFKDAGLDPEKPPTNWDELWAYDQKLGKVEGGKITRVGFHPEVSGPGFSTWAWLNGGDFIGPNNTFVINSKANVDALDNILKWDQRYGGKQALDAFAATFGPGNQDKFMSQKVAIIIDIPGYTSFLNFYNPNFSTEAKERLGYGVAAIPPAPGHKPVALSGGFALSIPRGAKNIDAAWEFIKYATYVGQVSWARDTYSMPTVEQIAKSDPVLNADPNWPFFVEAMSYGRRAEFNALYPAWSDVLGPAEDAARSGKASAQDALTQAQQKAEQEAAKNKK